MQFWFEIGKLAVALINPIVIAVIGFFLLRRVEGIKTLVANQSDFEKKWAEEFFSCGQEFLKAMERYLALLTTFANMDKETQGGKFDTELREEFLRLSVTLPELELRTRRCVVFAPSSGGKVAISSESLYSLAREFVKNKGGSLELIILKMNEFNLASREAHAEMLGLRTTK